MFTMRLDLSLCGMWYCEALVLRQEHVSTKSLGKSTDASCLHFHNTEVSSHAYNRIGHLAILLTHTSLFPHARKPATKPLGPTPSPPNPRLTHRSTFNEEDREQASARPQRHTCRE